MRLIFVVPPLTGPLTGGTIYNLLLSAALTSSRLSLVHCALEETPRVLDADWVWVDSLYLAHVPELRARLSQAARIGLLLHYLPSLLEQRQPHALSDVERRALHCADQIVTPSETLRALVEQHVPHAHCRCCEPGVELVARCPAAARERSCVMVCNVTENKGVLELLRELAQSVRPSDDFTLEIVGRLDQEPAYAAECRRFSATQPWLREHVRWSGGLGRERALERIAHSSVFVSASRMESYGMALAEARAHGTPVLARAGGHAAAHVAADSGGELAQDACALARAMLSLMRAPAELARRLELAARSTPARSWSDTAGAFQRICSGAACS